MVKFFFLLCLERLHPNAWIQEALVKVLGMTKERVDIATSLLQSLHAQANSSFAVHLLKDLFLGHLK
jgi:hypothetical protein